MEENKGLNNLVLLEREKSNRIVTNNDEIERKKYVEV